MPNISPAPSNPNLGDFHYNGSESFNSNTGYVNSWTRFSANYQVAFSANFSEPAAVPEIDTSAATLPLAAALIALLIIADRRQRLAV